MGGGKKEEEKANVAVRNLNGKQLLLLKSC